MRKLIFVIVIVCFLGGFVTVFAQFPSVLIYNKLVNVINQTGESGYFGICDGAAGVGNKVLCSIPQKINEGDNRILVPGLQTAYPFFSTMDEKAYTCGTTQEPTKQLFLSLAGGVHTLVIGSFLSDKNGNRIAVSCSVAGG